jgi:hypothetical protein
MLFALLDPQGLLRKENARTPHRNAVVPFQLRPTFKYFRRTPLLVHVAGLRGAIHSKRRRTCGPNLAEHRIGNIALLACPIEA